MDVFESPYWAGSGPGLRAFAGTALPLLALETASYDLRFGGEGVIRGRYLFYVAPILLIATAAALVGRFPVRGLVGASAFFAATVAFADFHRFPGIYLDSAESVLNGVIRDVSPGLPPGVFVALCRESSSARSAWPSYVSPDRR